MPVQTSYTIEHSKAYEGGRADSGNMRADAALNKTGAEIPHGRFVSIDTTAGRLTNLGPNDYTPIKLPAAAGDLAAGVAFGVVLHDQAHDPNGSGNSGGVLDGNMCSVIRAGRVYVKTEQAVQPGDPVYVRHTANGAGTAPGQFRKDADTANAVALPTARFCGKAGAGEIVAVELNLP